MKILLIQATTLIFFLTRVVPALQDSRQEAKLFQNLLAEYDSELIPLPQGSASAPVNVSVTPTLLRILELKIKENAFVAHFWFTVEWKDTRLSWNPSQYGNTSEIRFPSERIWTPDIAIYNSISADNRRSFIRADSKVIIKHDGTVLYVQPLITETTCLVNLNRYPFDQQMCKLKLGSWTYGGSTLNLLSTSEHVDLSSFMLNLEWSVEDATVVRNVMSYQGIPDTYMDITATLVLQRIPGSHELAVLFSPALLLVLGLLIFCLPLENTGRVALDIFITVSTIVDLLFISENFQSYLPRPIIVRYVDAVILLLITFTSVTIILMKIYNTERKILTPLRGLALKKLAAILGFGCCQKSEGSEGRTKFPATSAEEVQQKTIEELRFEPATSSESEWKLLAKILDRITFILFAVISLTVSVYYFVQL